MKKNLFLILSGAVLLACNQKSTTNIAAKLNLSKITAAELPSDIQIDGNLQEASKWTDKDGEHIFITSITEPVNNSDDEMFLDRDMFIYGKHYVLENGNSNLKWIITDFEKKCDQEISVTLAKESEVTDLNNNGISEVWMMYRTMCAGDVNPSNQKIIMYEGDKKYAVRGTSIVQLGEDEDAIYQGGEYDLDENFQKAPEVIKNYAIEMWKNNSNDNF